MEEGFINQIGGADIGKTESVTAYLRRRVLEMLLHESEIPENMTFLKNSENLPKLARYLKAIGTIVYDPKKQSEYYTSNIGINRLNTAFNEKLKTKFEDTGYQPKVTAQGNKMIRDGIEEKKLKDVLTNTVTNDLSIEACIVFLNMYLGDSSGSSGSNKLKAILKVIANETRTDEPSKRGESESKESDEGAARNPAVIFPLANAAKRLLRRRPQPSAAGSPPEAGGGPVAGSTSAVGGVAGSTSAVGGVAGSTSAPGPAPVADPAEGSGSGPVASGGLAAEEGSAPVADPAEGSGSAPAPAEGSAPGSPPGSVSSSRTTFRRKHLSKKSQKRSRRLQRSKSSKRQ